MSSAPSITLICSSPSQAWCAVGETVSILAYSLALLQQWLHTVPSAVCHQLTPSLWFVSLQAKPGLLWVKQCLFWQFESQFQQSLNATIKWTGVSSGPEYFQRDYLSSPTRPLLSSGFTQGCTPTGDKSKPCDNTGLISPWVTTGWWTLVAQICSSITKLPHAAAGIK